MRVVTIKKVLVAFTFPLLLVAVLSVRPHLAQAAACTAPTTDYGTDTLSISVPATGQYQIWTRMAAPDTTNNTYLLEVTGTTGTKTCYTVGGSTVPVYGSGASTYFVSGSSNWTDKTSTGTVISPTLNAGTNTLKLIGNAPNVVIDRVVLTQSTTCVPTGTGDNCADPPDTTSPTVSLTAPTGGASLTSTPTLTANAQDDTAIKQVDFYVGGVKVGTDTSGNANNYSYTLTSAQALTVGSHTFYAIATDTSNNTAQSSTVNATVVDTTPPVISAVGNSSITQTSATVTWSTNEASDSQVEYGTTTSYGSSTTLNTSQVTSHSVSVSGLTSSTLYHYRVKSKDAAGNLATSADGTFTTQAPAADTTAPTVSLTAPAAGSVSGTIVVSANASDNVGVVGVQFKLDGNNLGAEDTTSGYSTGWNTTGTANGTYTLTAVARDAAGNVKTSTGVQVTVNNVIFKSADVNQDGSVNILDFSLLAGKFGQSGAGLGRSDINGDGTVNILDFSLLAGQFGT